MSNLKDFLDSLRGLFSAPAATIDAERTGGGDGPLLFPTMITHHKDTLVTDMTAHVRGALLEFNEPRRIGFARIMQPDSMSGFINRFRDENSVVFATLGDRHKGGHMSPRMVALINYDKAGPETFSASLGMSEQARKKDHGAIYDFPLTDAFAAWLAIGRSGVDQAGLHNFLQDRIEDFMDPTPAMIQKDPAMAEEEWEERLARLAQRLNSRFGDYRTLLAASLTFQVDETQNLKVSRNPDTGETRFEFQNEHSNGAGARIELPNLFLLGVQVFVGGPIYRLPVRLRYAKEGPKVKFFLTIPQAADVMERATRQLVQEVVDKIDEPIPLFWGEAS